MRFSTALAVFSLFAASVSATYTPAYGLSRRQSPPSCEADCLAHPSLGNCKANDLTCLCNNSDFVQGTFNCIQAACHGADLAAAINIAAATCQAVGVTLSSASGAAFSATASLGSSAPAGASTPAASAPSSTASAPGASTTPATTGGALASTANTALLGLAAVGVIAFSL
ncbi:hypothetical protein DFH08DRAFT_254561 [Mycena albidolilacea]|uniref:CFEM domain-containing protein n=1 Tax=Mycena albidolilacea TaxID=1033008 RepID=A0AAD6ZT17_9AGAR|nr:hypothetical protein DFH08DRAFT_254561 [Mycena albidolilacea]